MLKKRMLVAFSYVLMFAAAALIFGCAKPEETTPEASVSPQKAEAQPQQAPQSQLQQTSQTKPAEAPKLPQPKIADVHEAIKRVFQKAVSLDEKHNPSFFVGDFNGDGSQDLAVIVKPAEGMLPEINSELANWILEDPQKVAAPSPGSRRIPAPVRVEKGDSLLAVIHGYGPDGWRNPSAKQTYLLKNGAGVNMRSQTARDLIASAKDKKKPALRDGDVISQTLAGQQGFLYWTGAKYGWYDWSQDARGK